MGNTTGNPDKSATLSQGDVSARLLYGMVLLSGMLMLILAGMLNSYFLRFLSPDRMLSPQALSRIHWTQARFVIVGVALIAAGLGFRRYGVFRALARRATLMNITLMISALVLFLFVVNNALAIRFYPKPLTSLFIPDETLGWRLRPNAEEDYAGVRYKISPKGLRSPHSEYAKSANTKRILQLGDSSTIGYGVEYEGTSAHMLERMFEASPAGFSVEVINAGCEGYSQWQEYELLKSEGIKYGPDLITVGFVPNDVTEKFRLTAFGGRAIAARGIGGQLAHAKTHRGISQFLFYRIIARTPLYIFLREKFLTRRFGDDIREAATRMEELHVKDLIYNRDDELVLRAWEATLADLGTLVAYCSDNDLGLLVIALPFTFQLELPDSLAYPQQVLRDFCDRNDVHLVDCLPALWDAMRVEGKPAQAYFVDGLHPSAEGNRVIARATFDYIQAHNLLGDLD